MVLQLDGESVSAVPLDRLNPELAYVDSVGLGNGVVIFRQYMSTFLLVHGCAVLCGYSSPFAGVLNLAIVAKSVLASTISQVSQTRSVTPSLRSQTKGHAMESEASSRYQYAVTTRWHRSSKSKLRPDRSADA